MKMRVACRECREMNGESAARRLKYMQFVMLKRIRTWTELNRDICVDIFRMWFGAALFLKGIAVSRHANVMAMHLQACGLSFASDKLVNIAALAHLVGGTMLVFGVFTRFAALIQVPNVLVALVFVHARNGIVDEGFELATISLLLLIGFFLIGPGRLSTDWYFSEHPRQNIDGERLALMRAHPEPEDKSYSTIDLTLEDEDVIADESTTLTDLRPAPIEPTPKPAPSSAGSTPHS